MRSQQNTQASTRPFFIDFLIIVLPFFLIGLFISVMAESYFRVKEVNRINEYHIKHLKSVYQKSLESAIWDYRLTDIESIAETIISSPAFKGVTIKQSLVEPVVSLGDMSSNEIVSLELDLPISKESGAWMLNISIDGPNKGHIILSFTRQFSSVFLFFLIFSGLGAYFAFTSMFLVPTRQLRHTLTHYTRQSTLAQIEPSGSKETSQVIAGYNKMAQVINTEKEITSKQRELSEYHFTQLRNLSELIANKTSVLKNSI